MIQHLGVKVARVTKPVKKVCATMVTNFHAEFFCDRMSCCFAVLLRVIVVLLEYYKHMSKKVT